MDGYNQSSWERLTSWRAVSCASILLKGMEKPVEKYITGTFLVDRPLSSEQFAYQPGKSSEMALSRLVRQVEKNFSDREVMIAIFLDIQGAFDNVSFGSILRAMQAHGVDFHTVKWIESLLSTRRCVTELSGERLGFQVAQGCPQGGVLSPMMWNMVADGALRRLKENGFDCQGFADDLWALVKGRFGDIVSCRAQTAIDVFYDWADEEHLTAHPDKIKVLAFTRRTSEKRRLLPLRIRGQEISYSDRAKVLGVVIDDKLTWNEHLRYAVERGRQTLFTCRKMVGKTWGLRPRIVKWLYDTIIRPRVTYAAGAWWKKSEQTTCQNELEKFQRLVCMMITSAFKTSPTAALLAELNIVPLYIDIQRDAMVFTYKLWKNEDQFLQGLADPLLVERLRTMDGLLSGPSDLMPTRFCFEKNFRLIYPSREDWADGCVDCNADMVWWTDGARNANGVGSGAYEQYTGAVASFQICSGRGSNA